MPERRRARFVFITGLSGSGKTLAMKALEDAGFFCVDNLPAKLILSFAELTAQGGESIDRVAIAADIRERGFLKDFPDAHRRLEERGFPATLVFLEARNEILVRRFSESRRPHPLQRQRHRPHLRRRPSRRPHPPPACRNPRLVPRPAAESPEIRDGSARA